MEHEIQLHFHWFVSLFIQHNNESITRLLVLLLRARLIIIFLSRFSLPLFFYGGVV